MAYNDYLSRLSIENILDCPLYFIEPFLGFDLDDNRGVLPEPSSSISKDIDLYLSDKLLLVTVCAYGSVNSSKLLINSMY